MTITLDSHSVVPIGFWPQIDQQLARVAHGPENDFDAVRAVLLDTRYDAVMQEIERNSPRTFDADSAFFAGSGGNDDLHGALLQAGWRTVQMDSKSHYTMRHPGGDQLVYLEGDVYRGAKIDAPCATQSAFNVAREAMDKHFGDVTWTQRDLLVDAQFAGDSPEREVTANDIANVIVTAILADRAVRTPSPPKRSHEMADSNPVITVVITETTVRTYRLDADALAVLGLPASGAGIDDLDDDQLSLTLIDDFDADDFAVTEREAEISRAVDNDAAEREDGCTSECRHRCPVCRMGLVRHLPCDPQCELNEARAHEAARTDPSRA